MKTRIDELREHWERVEREFRDMLLAESAGHSQSPESVLALHTRLDRAESAYFAEIEIALK